MYICIYIYIYIHMYVYMVALRQSHYIYVYVRTYIYIYIHTYICIACWPFLVLMYTYVAIRQSLSFDRAPYISDMGWLRLVGSLK